jgi:cytidylate kinase
VICPDAAVKLFVTATDAVRAERRHAELARKGHGVTLQDVVDDLAERDARDQGRTDAPLAPAPDALVLDTSTLSIEEATEAAIAIVAEARERQG